MAHRLMRDAAFRQSQVAGTDDQHVAPINALVRRLRDHPGRTWMPYVAPAYGGVEATVLILARDPGPKTDNQHGNDGSGFLCAENDDPSAERLALLLDWVHLRQSECIVWNAYPWYVHGSDETRHGLPATYKDVGVPPLVELLALLPNLRAVVLLGGDAQDTWKRLEKRHPELPSYHSLPTRHTGKQAFIGTREQRAKWEADQLETFRTAAALARGGALSGREAEPTPRASDAFSDWLIDQGWAIVDGSARKGYTAIRDGETLVVVGNRRGVSTQEDRDRCYGQLLRKMSERPAARTRYAVVGTSNSRADLLRVPKRVRDALSIDIYTADADGTVTDCR